jgi:hypothetical protein
LAKIDLDLINQNGHRRPVPKEMDTHIIKYVIGKRIDAVKKDSGLLQWQRWNHSKVFYDSRTHLNRNGWDTSVYSDTAIGGKERRSEFYSKIKDVCEKFYGVKRHEIGIFPNDRATMTFIGQEHAVSFHSLPRLMHNGTDIVFVEKQSTVTLMSPYTETVGISFIDSEGFGSEYGIALARLCDMQTPCAYEYTSAGNGKYYFPKHRGHLANITDCDVSGVAIGIKVNGSDRLGLDLDSIEEINNVNPGLDLTIEDLHEDIDTSKNTHYLGLLGIFKGKGKLHDSLTESERYHYKSYLSKRFEVDGEEIRFIDWLAKHRIELDTVLAVSEPEGFWNWLKWKLVSVWPERNYNRAILLNDSLNTPTMDKFIEWHQNLTRSVIADKVKEKKDHLSKVEGLYDDIESEQQEIEADIINNSLLTNEQVQKVDLALNSIMNNGRP